MYMQLKMQLCMLHNLLYMHLRMRLMLMKNLMHMQYRLCGWYRLHSLVNKEYIFGLICSILKRRSNWPQNCCRSEIRLNKSSIHYLPDSIYQCSWSSGLR